MRVCYCYGLAARVSLSRNNVFVSCSVSYCLQHLLAAWISQCVVCLHGVVGCGRVVQGCARLHSLSLIGPSESPPPSAGLMHWTRLAWDSPAWPRRVRAAMAAATSSEPAPTVRACRRHRTPPTAGAVEGGEAVCLPAPPAMDGEKLACNICGWGPKFLSWIGKS